MNDRIYESDAQQLRIASQKIKSCLDELRADSGRLRNEFDALSVCWSGEASQKLISGFRNDADQFDEALKELAEFYDTMKKVCRTEEENEEALERYVSGISL